MPEAADHGSEVEVRQIQPTIRDVARVAGVSISTVSKALNNQGKLRETTRNKVRQAADQLGFRPNDLAQSLLRGRSFTVGLITTDSYGRFSMPLLLGIEDALGAARISVFLCNATDDPARERQHIDALLAKKVDGIIVTGRRIDPRESISVGTTRTPIIYAYSLVADSQALCLLPDEAQGVRLAVEHLIGLGRRRFAHITGPIRFGSVRIRAEAMQQVLKEHGLDIDDTHILAGTWQERWGYDAAHLLLDLDPAIDAIFCGNDLIARGVIDRLRERGVRVPGDVAIVGFDNWEIIAEGSRPPLTSVDMNFQELGRTAATKLLASIGGTPEAGVLRLPCSLVVRQSCGAVSSDLLAA